MFCHVTPNQVLGVHDCTSVYHVPILLNQQKLVEQLQQRLQLPNKTLSPRTIAFNYQWKQLARRHSHLHEDIHIALVGKYTQLQDSYISVVKALQHAAVACNRRMVIDVHS